MRDRRTTEPGDRRRVRRGGRRAKDRPGRHPVVLVADSQHEARTQSARYLEDCGFYVLEVSNGDEALAAIRAKPPHMILMELTLPRLPAWRLPAYLAQHERTRDLPMIVLHPEIVVLGDFEGRASDPIRCRPAGMLVKPYPPEVMREEMRRVLRMQAARAHAVA